MRRLKVAHVIYSPAVGGSEMMAAAICGNLPRDEFEPMVIFMYEGDGMLPAQLQKLGIPYDSFRCSTIRRLLGDWLFSPVLLRHAVDILHVHHIPLYLLCRGAARRAGVKALVVTEHAKYSISRSERLKEGCREAARQASCLTVVSEDLKEYFAADLGIPRKSVRVIHNGVDVDRFAGKQGNQTLRSLLSADVTGPVVITVGRLAEAKDHRNLLAAIQLLCEKGVPVRLVVVGDGELRQELERETEERGLCEQVHFAGSRPDVDCLLASASIFVLSSQREGLPMVLLEAMAAGLPVVSTGVGGIPEVIQNGTNGLLVPPRDPSSLASAIEDLIRDPEFSHRLAEEGQRFVRENYSIKSVCGEYAEIYHSLVMGQPS